MSRKLSSATHDMHHTAPYRLGEVDAVAEVLRARSGDMTAVLTALGFEAEPAGRWIERFRSTIRYARRGDQLAADDLNRADLVDQLRTVYRHRDGKTTVALQALTRIENEFFGGARIPEPTVRQRFFQAQGSVWDKLFNRWYCQDCGEWADQDHRHPLLGCGCPCSTDRTASPPAT